VSKRLFFRGSGVPSPARLERCPRCALHRRLCLCAEIRPLELATRVVVLRHRKETHKPTNTGRLVPLALTRGELRSFGGRGVVFDATGLMEPARRAVLLYPSARSRLLTSDQAASGPITLIVPDADWRRAHKLATREPALAEIPHVRLPDGAPSNYRLRHHPDPCFLATFEAVARALGILEGDRVQAHLERLFALLVERALWSRGRISAEDMIGGLPPLAS